MKHLLKFNESIQDFDQIRKFIQSYFFKQQWVNLENDDFRINQDGSVDFFDIWNFHYRGLKLPFKINSIRSSSFTIQPIGDKSKHMTNLENLPESINYISISSLPIKNLYGSLQNIQSLTLYDIPTLTSLEGGPDSINNLFIHDCQNLYTTGGWVPKNTDRRPVGISTRDPSTTQISWISDKDTPAMYINASRADSGPPKYVPFVYTTPILNIWKHFKTSFDFLESVKDYNYIRGNEINHRIFLQACVEYKINPPEKIEKYIFV